MKSTTQRRRISKKRSKTSGTSKKVNHRRPHKPFDPHPPTPPAPPTLQRAERKARNEYNTFNPFDSDIPLHDVTGQPLHLPNRLIACPNGDIIPAHLLYPTAEEFSIMHSVKPANRFGRARNLASSSSPAATSAPSAHSTSTGSDVWSLVEQLKAKGLDPEDEIMLAYLKQIDAEGQTREYYHNAAEACERAEALHPVHVKMVRYRRAMRDGALSVRDYEQLMLELEQRGREEERLKAEEEAKRRAEEERLRAEEERLRAEEVAKREAERREERRRRWEWEMEQQRFYAECERARREEIREMELERARQAQHEQWLRDEQERLRRVAIERERENEFLTLKWTRMLEQQKQRDVQALADRAARERAEQERRARELAAQEHRDALQKAMEMYKAKVVASYEATWKALRARKYAPGSLTYANFPLPIFHNALEPRPIAIAPEAVSEFVLSSLRADANIKPRKQRVKDELRLWHSDKFEAMILPMVREIDQEKVLLAADNIVKILNVLKNEL